MQDSKSLNDGRLGTFLKASNPGEVKSAMSAVRDNTALSRFELDADGVTAFMNYHFAGPAISLDHTETPEAARGRGIASQLVRGVLDDVRGRGLKIVPRCSFVRVFLDQHPDYRDLVAEQEKRP